MLSHISLTSASDISKKCKQPLPLKHEQRHHWHKHPCYWLWHAFHHSIHGPDDHDQKQPVTNSIKHYYKCRSLLQLESFSLSYIVKDKVIEYLQCSGWQAWQQIHHSTPNARRIHDKWKPGLWYWPCPWDTSIVQKAFCLKWKKWYFAKHDRNIQTEITKKLKIFL